MAATSSSEMRVVHPDVGRQEIEKVPLEGCQLGVVRNRIGKRDRHGCVQHLELDLGIELLPNLRIVAGSGIEQHLVDLGVVVVGIVEIPDVARVEEGAQHVGVSIGEPEEGEVVVTRFLLLRGSTTLHYVNLNVDADLTERALDK